jgi:hypothetical protein
MMTKCSWDRCKATTETPGTNGWAYLFAWGHGVKDGDHCPEHRNALEAVLMENGGTLNDLDDDIDDEEGDAEFSLPPPWQIPEPVEDTE